MTPIVTIERHIVAASPLGWWGGIALLVVILTVSLGLLRREIAGRRRSIRSTPLILLRLAVVLLLGLLVVQPVFVVRREERRAGKVVFSVDRSRSMLRGDALDGTELLNLADAVGVVGLADRERDPQQLAREIRGLETQVAKWRRVVRQIGEERQQGWPSSPVSLAGMKSLATEVTATAAKIAELSTQLGAVEKILAVERPIIPATGPKTGAETQPSATLSLGKSADIPNAMREVVEKSSDLGELADADKLQAALAAWDALATLARDSLVELERVQVWLDHRFIDKLDGPAKAELVSLSRSSRFEIAKRFAAAVSHDPAVSSRHEIELRGFEELTEATAANETDLFASMQNALSSDDRDAITALVMLTDGGQNVPDRPAVASRLAGRSVTLLGVPIGGEGEQADVAVREIITPRVALKGKSFDAVVVLKTAVPEGTVIEVAATDGDNPIASSTIKADGKQTAQVRLAIRPSDKFTHSMTIRASINGGDALPANDTSAVGIEVLDRASRVLVVGDQPTWDTAALMRALTKLPTRVDSVFWRKVVEKASEQENSRGRIPGTAAGFKRYDVIVLVGTAFPGMGEADGKLLQDWVTKDGGRLIILGAGTEYASRLPFLSAAASERNLTLAVDETAALVPTGPGAGLPMVSLSSDPGWSKGLWGSLASPQKVIAAPKQRVAALACGDKDILTVGLHGRGRVYALSVDDLYRSREWAPEGLLDNYWLRLAEDLIAPGLTETTNVGVYPTHPLTGGSAWVLALSKDQPKGVIKSGSASDAPLVFENSGGDDAGRLWIAQPAVRFTDSATVHIDGKPEDVVVQSTSPIYREDLSAKLDEAALSRVVGYARGEVVRPASLIERLASMPPREDRKVSVTEHRVWNAWPLLLILACLMTAEWVVRRRSGFAL